MKLLNTGAIKVAYADVYTPQISSSLHKDVATIPIALSNNGLDVELISTITHFAFKKDASMYGLPIKNLIDIVALGWANSGLDVVIFVSRLAKIYNPHLKAIKEAGIRVVIKTDSDGTWGFPVPPNYLNTCPILQSPLNIFRHIKWKVPLRYFLLEKFEQIKLADAVVVESPAAFVNATTVLNYWGFFNLCAKLRCIPNPVSPSVNKIIIDNKRNNTLVAVARWDDNEVKNTKVMLQASSIFLQKNKNFQFKVFGTGLNQHLCDKYLGKFIMDGRVHLYGHVSHEELQKQFSNAKIVFVPSKLESFCFVAAEALCAGCSIVVTPLESLLYLSGGGKWGTYSKGFDYESLSIALNCEAFNWQHGIRDCNTISNYWRSELEDKHIAILYQNLLHRLFVS